MRSTCGGIGCVAEDRRRESQGVDRIEALEVDPLREARSLELGQPGTHRVASVQLVGAHGQDRHDPLRSEAAHQVGHRVPRGGVCPVEVLQHEEQRRVLGQALDDAEDRLEHARLRPLALGRTLHREPRGETGHKTSQVRPVRADDRLEHVVRQVRRERPEGLHERAVGQAPVADVGA